MLRRLSFLLILGIALYSAVVVTAQTDSVPPPVTAALAAFNRYLTQPITLEQLDSYQFTEGTYADTALGCTLVAGTPLASPISAFKVQFVYQSVLYEIEVSADTSLIVPCSAPLLTQTTITPAATLETIGLTGCPVDFAGYLPPRLTVGGFARIGVDGQPNRMRAAPNLEGEQIGLIAPGTTVEVLDGPVCEAGAQIVWWQVRDADLVGYTAESAQSDYYLEPIDFGALPILPGGRETITAANASSLVTLSAIPFEGGATVDFGGLTQLLVAGTSGVTFYDLEQLTVGNLPLPPDTAALHVNYSPDGRYIAYSTDANQLYVYDTSADQTLQLEIDDDAIINDLDFSPNNLLAVAIGDPLGGDATVNGWSLYDLQAGDRSAYYPTDSWVGDVAFGPAGLRLAWLTDSVNMIILQGDLPIITGQIGQPTRTGLAWQPVADPTDPAAAFRLVYADGSIIQLFDVETGDLVSYTNPEDYRPGTLAFSADGSVLAVLNRAVTDEPMPRTLRVFDVVTQELLYSETLETARGMTFSPDGTLIVVLTDTTLRFYGITTMQEAVG